MFKIAPDQAMSLASQARQAGRLDEAARWYEQVLGQVPENAEANFQLGELLFACGQRDRGIQLMGNAAKIAPTHATYQNDFGMALFDAGRWTDALAPLRRAAALLPGSYAVHNNLGMLLVELGEWDEALNCYRQSIALHGNSAIVFNNLAVLLQEIGPLDEADQAFRRAIELDPNDAEFHWNHSLLLLSMGNCKRGWQEFEWRLKVPKLNLNRGFPQKQWDGSNAQAREGASILLHGEGGFGDTLQFVRLVPRLNGNGARFILECQPALAPLLQGTAGVEQVLPRGAALPAFDLHLPLPSLPGVLGITMENIPRETPYLKVPDDRRKKWSGRIDGQGQLKVGLVWAGSQSGVKQPRSRTLDVYAPLAAIPGVRFFSLQVGPEARQTPPANLSLIDLSADLQDFADTAAVIDQLDLVISVDTSVAHLAGALAKPVWVLIPTRSDFRWLHNRTDNPWYPTMRLFRQQHRDDWTSVMRDMTEALRALAAQPRPT